MSEAVAAAPPASRLRRWTGILAAYFGTQTLTQLLGIAAGLLLVRFLPVREFALYTLAASVSSFFTFVSDLGSTTSLLHFFRHAAREGENFGRYLAAVLSLRRMAFALGAVAVLAAFPAMAIGKGFPWLDSLLVTAGIVTGAGFQIVASLRVLALRLEDRYGRSYRAEVAGSGARLLLTLAMVATGWLRAWLAVLGSALGTAATARLAAPRQPAGAGLPATPAADLGPYRRKVLRYLLPTLPSALYFSIQGPLVVWLAATFGSARNIAEVGALGRLGLAVGLFSGLTGVVFLPRLARIGDDRLFRTRFLQFGALLAAIALALLAAARLYPKGFLFLLGQHYAGLDRELLLVVGAAGLTLLDGYAVAINLARSWTRWQVLAVGGLIAAQAAFAMLLPLSTTAGVLRFNLLSAAAALAGQAAIAAIGFLRPDWVAWR
jgi:O-antigen/teichoic acid export membrane protein